MTTKKSTLEKKAELCPFTDRCAIDSEKNHLACLGEANYNQCVIYREFSKTDPKYLKKSK